MVPNKGEFQSRLKLIAILRLRLVSNKSKRQFQNRVRVNYKLGTISHTNSWLFTANWSLIAVWPFTTRVFAVHPRSSWPFT